MSDRDIEAGAPRPATRAGRNVIVTIGIDRYRDRELRPLRNAVNDAQGVRAVFQQLGFEQFGQPLLNDRATGEAIRALNDELGSLSPDDNLVVYFAGHGSWRTHAVGELQAKTGYLIPHDGKAGRAATWIEVDAWLRQIARQPPRHILVILDSCHSGVALSSVKWGRDDGRLASLPFGEQSARHSRLVIASALDTETALDAGFASSHSLFTGCLIEALRGGVRPVVVRDGRGYTTGTDLAHYVRRRVQSYPGAPGRAQSPDYGALEFDQRGEMLIPLRSTGPLAAGLATADVAVPTPMADSASAVVDTAPAPRVLATEAAPGAAARARSASLVRACAVLVAVTAAAYVGIERVVATRGVARGVRATAEPSAPAPGGVGELAAGSAAAAGVDDAPGARDPAGASEAPRKPATPPRGARPAMSGAAASKAAIVGGANKHAASPATAAVSSPSLGSGRRRGIAVIPDEPPRRGEATVARERGAGPSGALADRSATRRTTAVTACRAAGARSASEVAGAASCFVQLRSTPVGAEILRGAELVGHAPCLLTLPCSADVELTFRKLQYFDTEKTVRATADGPEVVARLSRAEHSMTVVSTPGGATVTLNGKRYGATPIALRFPAYQRSKLEVSKAGYATETREVDALPKLTIAVELKPVSAR